MALRRSLVLALGPLALAACVAACVDGVTADCASPGNQCGPDRDASFDADADAGPVVLPEAGAGDADAASDSAPDGDANLDAARDALLD